MDNAIRKYLGENATLDIRKKEKHGRDVYRIIMRKTSVFEADEPYVYHPEKRVKIAVASAGNKRRSGFLLEALLKGSIG